MTMRARRISVLLIIVLLWPLAAAAQVFEIGEIAIEGNRRVEESSIRAALSVDAGDSVTIEDIDRDIRAIFEMGRFADVVAEIEERAEVTVLVYRLTERPLVRSIRFEGNEEFDRDKLRSLIKLRTPDIFNPKAVEDSVEAVVQAYKDEGFYGAEVEHDVEVNDQAEATVVFRIDEGKKVLIRDIAFEGNTILTDEELKDAIETREKWFLSWLTGRGAYKEEVIQTDLERIADRYYNRGYVRVKVKQPLVTLSDNREFLDLLIEIEEGQQYRTGDIDIQGDLLRPKEELLELVKVSPGEVFSREILRKSVLALNDLYANQGYAYVNVSPLTQIDPEEQIIDLVFEIEKGVQVSVERIEVAGNTKTRDKVIRREMELVEGDLFSASKLKESRRKVNNLGFFEEVNVTTGKGSDEEHMNVDVEVKERPTGTFSLGFGYSSVDGFIGQGSVSQDNFLGRALKLKLAGSFGGTSTTYQFGLTEPYFLDTEMTLGFDLYKTDREWTDFSRKNTGGDIKIGYPLSDTWRSFFIYRYEEKEIFEVDPLASLLIREQEGTSTLSSINASLTRDTTDYRLDPSRGAMTELSLEFAGLGGTEKFAKYKADHRHFFPFKWDTVLSVHGQIGYIQEVGGKEIPIDERFFLGGINTLRGFKSREVGPRDSATGDFTGGSKEAFFNIEYIFPLLKDMGLKGIVFFDTGNAWDDEEEFFSEMRYSVGGGIRWFSPMGPLRLEWGYNLDPKEYEDNSEFEFSIGKFF